MKLKKGVSLVLSLILVAQMCLPAVANSPVDSGKEEIVCTHHADHTAECGNTVGTPCTHAHTEACGATGVSCGHAHDAACGYTAGTPCAFNPATCPECNSQPEKPVEPTTPEKPEEPTVPDVPVEPTVPEVPVKPEVPLEPLAPALGAPDNGMAELTADGTIDISGANRYIVIEDSSYTIGGGAKIAHTGPYVLTGNTTNTNAANHILVRNSGANPIDITLQNVNISFGFEIEKCAFAIEQGAVNLTLVDNNELTSGFGKAGLQVEVGKSLTITKESSGMLKAASGRLNPYWGEIKTGGGAGIGGRNRCSAGTITIDGGTVVADGGNGKGDNPSGGAGIGGGHNGAGGTTTINGGNVNATGGKCGEVFGVPDGIGGAGIGGGFQGAGGDITINNGVVFATGSHRDERFGEGSGIGAGSRCEDLGNFSTGEGKAVITTRSISDKTNQYWWRGLIFYNKYENDGVLEGRFYGCSKFTLPGNFDISALKTLYMKLGQTLIIPEGVNLSTSQDGSFYINGGKIEGPGTISPMDNVFYGILEDTSYAINLTADKCNPCKGHVLHGSGTTLNVSGGTHNITLNNTILTSDNKAAFSLTNNATVNLTLAGYSKLTSGPGNAGLQVPKGSTLTIAEKYPGCAITVYGGSNSAGIGGSQADETGKIIIKSGTVRANGGANGAGIGGGSNGSGGSITIKNSTVLANSGTNSAGIGGGSNGDGGTITIENSTVTAKGGTGNGGAGIGGGSSGDGGTITIENSTVTAKGGTGNGGAGIGGGSSGDGGTITIKNSTVTAKGGSDSGAAGIGGGNGGAGGAVNIEGGRVTTEGGGGGGDGIGKGAKGKTDGTSFATNNAAIFTSNITDTSGRNNGTWRGMIFCYSGGLIYGDNFTLPGDITIPINYVLDMEEGQTLTVIHDTTLTVDGYIYTSGGKVVGYGPIVHPENIRFARPDDISTGNVDIYDSSCNPCKGHVIVGKTTQYSVNVHGGHHRIHLLDADIQNNYNTSAFALFNGATVDLTIRGTNTLLGDSYFAGLAVRQGNTLNITEESTGTLNVTGSKYAAGIGGDYNYNTSTPNQPGTININGGTVIATGGKYAAAIGGGYKCEGGTIKILNGDVTANGGLCGAGIGGGEYAKGGNVYIKSGKVTATGGSFGAGIGSGSGVDVDFDAHGATVTIDGGTVKATGGRSAAGIGGGYGCKSDYITIHGGTVTAKGLGDDGDHGGAGIGGGYQGSGGTITITGGRVNATGGDQGAGIGGGDFRNGAIITIDGGIVTAVGTDGGAGIGSGRNGGNSDAKKGGSITIRGGNVTAKGGINIIYGGAGIGSGYMGGKTITRIYGGTVTANGGEGSAGIGSGKAVSKCTDEVTIGGGTITANGGIDGAGIGGSYYSQITPVTINGGTITANGGQNAAGIGGGNTNKGGTVKIDGDAVIFAIKGANAPDHIGNGVGGAGASVSRTRGILFEGGSSSDFCGSYVQLKDDVTLPSGKNLTVPVGKTLTVPQNITLTNKANLFLDGGTINGAGNIAGNGTFKASIVSGDIGNIPDQIYTGNAIEPTPTVNTTRYILGKTFTVLANGFTKGYESNINAGTAKVKYTKGDQTAEKSFNIVKSGTKFEDLKTYKNGTETASFIYGDTITVKAKPVPNGTVANSFALMSAPNNNQMALYLGATQVSDPASPGTDGVYTLTCRASGNGFAIGDNILKAKYVGSDNMAEFSQTVTVTLNPKPISATVTGTVTKVYDGNTSFGNVPLTPIGVEGNDIVTAKADGTSASANAGTNAFIASAITLDGANVGFYTLLSTDVGGNVKITPATPTVSVTAEKKDGGLLLTATTKGVNGEKPDGTVVFTHGSGRAVLTTLLTVNGVASYRWSNPPAGSVTVKANFGASSSNYKSDVVTDEATVKLGKQEQTALSITQVIGKIYGDGSFALSTTGGSGNGAVTYTVTSGDAFTVSGNTATIVGVGDVTLTATKAEDSNYKSITSEPITIIIGKKPVTVTVTAQNKAYDGTNTANVSYMVSGTVGTDAITASGTGATFADKNVDTGKTVTATGIAISGGNVGKYTLTNTTAETVANITKKPLTWGNPGTVASKTYDGSTTASVLTLPTLTGMVKNETVVAIPGTVTFANANAGTHAITATGFGIDNANYSAPVGQPTFENGTINAKNVESPTVTVSGTHKFTGSQIKPAVTVKDGEKTLASGDYTATYGTNVNAGVNAGSVTVNLKGNYSGNATANFSIGKATSTSVVAPEPILMTEKTVKNYSIPLPTGAGNAGKLTYTVGVPSGTKGIFSKEPTINGTNLKFTSADTTSVGQTSSVVITIASDNYETFTVTLKFEITKKRSVELTGLNAAQNLVYNGSAQQGYTGTLLVEGREISVEDKASLIFTYTGINGTDYTDTVAPTNAGSYKLVISVGGTNVTYTGHHVDIPFTIAKKDVTVTAGGYTVTKPWNGTTTAGTPDGALLVSGILNDEATVTAKPQEYPSSAVSDSHSVIVDLALTGTGSENYVLENNTITVTGKITSGTAPVAPKPSATPEAKSATAITLKPVTVDGEVVEYAKGDSSTTPGTWQTDTTFGELKANKKYFFFARVAKNDNHGAGAASIGTPITTEKKVFEEENLGTVDGKPVTGADLLEPRSFLMPNAATKTSYLTLAEAFGTFLPTDAAFAKVTGPAEPLVMNSVAIKSGELVFTSKKNPVGFAATDVYTITMSSTDYQNFAFTMRFSASEKGNATITATLNGKEYDGAPMKEPTPSANVGSENVEFQYTYQWKRGDTALNAAPRNAGGYTLVINGSNDSLAGSLTIPFTIGKKPLTVTAGNTAVISGSTPTFTFTSDGLVTNETLTEVGYSCSYNKDNLDPGMARTAIIPKGGTVSSGNDNYTISYVPGTLTINPNSGALEAAIKEAKALKSSVETSNKAPNEMPYGKRFVTAEDRTAFENAIAVANQVATNAGNPQNIADAMTALAEATNAFKTAIKTGTYIYSDEDVEPSPQPTPQKHPADKFTDIKGHWAEENIRFVVEKNLFNGISDTLFAPDMTMTRGMLVTVLYRQAGSPTVEADKTTWYSTARAWAMKAGISDGTNMENTITRQELVTMLHRYAKHSGIDVSVGEDTNILSYNDAFDLPQWSIPAFQWACGANIVDGIDGSLLPTTTATRAQVSTMLKRFAELKAK